MFPPTARSIVDVSARRPRLPHPVPHRVRRRGPPSSLWMDSPHKFTLDGSNRHSAPAFRWFAWGVPKLNPKLVRLRRRKNPRLETAQRLGDGATGMAARCGTGHSVRANRALSKLCDASSSHARPPRAFDPQVDFRPLSSGRFLFFWAVSSSWMC